MNVCNLTEYKRICCIASVTNFLFSSLKYIIGHLCEPTDFLYSFGIKHADVQG